MRLPGSRPHSSRRSCGESKSAVTDRHRARLVGPKPEAPKPPGHLPKEGSQCRGRSCCFRRRARDRRRRCSPARPRRATGLPALSSRSQRRRAGTRCSSTTVPPARTLTPAGSYPTGGNGSGGGLGSQGSLILAAHGHRLFAVNAASNSVTEFKVDKRPPEAGDDRSPPAARRRSASPTASTMFRRS